MLDNKLKMERRELKMKWKWRRESGGHSLQKKLPPCSVDGIGLWKEDKNRGNKDMDPLFSPKATHSLAMPHS